MKCHTSQSCFITVFAVTYLGHYVLFFNWQHENLRASGCTAHVPRGASQNTNTPKLKLVIITSQHTVSKCFSMNFNTDLQHLLSPLVFHSKENKKSLVQIHEYILQSFDSFISVIISSKKCFPIALKLLLQFEPSSGPVFMWTSSPLSQCSLICPYWSVLSLILHCALRHHVEPQQCVYVWIFLLRHH